MSTLSACGDVPCSLCGAYHVTLQCPSFVVGPTWPGWPLQPLDNRCALCGNAGTCMYCKPPGQWSTFSTFTLKQYDCVFCGQKGISPLVYHDCKLGAQRTEQPSPDPEIEAMYDEDSGDA